MSDLGLSLLKVFDAGLVKMGLVYSVLASFSYLSNYITVRQEPRSENVSCKLSEIKL